MRLQRTSLSIFPSEIEHMKARQQMGEQFICLASGELTVKMLSPVFS